MELTDFNLFTIGILFYNTLSIVAILDGTRYNGRFADSIILTWK